MKINFGARHIPLWSKVGIIWYNLRAYARTDQGYIQILFVSYLQHGDMLYNPCTHRSEVSDLETWAEVALHNVPTTLYPPDIHPNAIVTNDMLLEDYLNEFEGLEEEAPEYDWTFIKAKNET